jgi:hypothetical protein
VIKIIIIFGDKIIFTANSCIKVTTQHYITIVLVFNNVFFNKIKDRTIWVMKGGRSDWRIINKTSINVFFKIKKSFLRINQWKLEFMMGNSFIPGFSSSLYRMAKPPKYRPFFDWSFRKVTIARNIHSFPITNMSLSKKNYIVLKNML